MAMKEEDLKVWIEKNGHVRDYTEGLIQREYLHSRDDIFNLSYDLQSMDKRKKEYAETQKKIAFRKAIMPQLADAYEKLTGRKIPNYVDPEAFDLRNKKGEE